MFAFVILLLVALYTMSTFASGQRHYLRAQQLSLATTLVHSQMEQFLAQPLAEIQPVTNGTISQAPGYTYQLSVNQYVSPASDLFELDLTVRSPLGAMASASTFKGRETTPQGISCDPNSNLVAFLDGTQLREWSDDVSATTTNVSGPPVGPDGAIAGSPGSGLLWAVNSVGGLSKWVESPTTANAGTWTAVNAPTTGQACPVRFSSVAGDASGWAAFVGDTSNRCLWRLQDNVTAAAPVWKSFQPTMTSLGAPSAVACDPFGSVVWVADAENQCLRKFIPGPNTVYPAAYVDGGATGFWLDVQYHPPAQMGMGIPKAIAMDPYSYNVYVMDGARIYKFVDDPNPANVTVNKGIGGPGTWKVLTNITAPSGPDLSTAQACGLTADFFDDVFYINCRGPESSPPAVPQLWKLKPGSGFTQLF